MASSPRWACFFYYSLVFYGIYIIYSSLLNTKERGNKIMWVIFSLLASILNAVQSEINKNYKVDGFRLNTYRSFISTVVMIPLIGFIEWNLSAYYYFVTFVVALLSIGGMVLQYDLAAKKNGRVACLHQPVGVVITFIFWLCLKPEEINFFIENWINAMAILVSFGLFAYGFSMVRKSDTGAHILSTVVSIALLFSLSTIVSKIALETNAEVIGVSLNFVMVCNLFMFLISFPIFVYRLNQRKFTITKKDIKGAAYISVSHTVSWILLCFALIYAENPAYVSVLIGLTPLWFMIYYKLRNIKDDSNPRAGLIMAFSAILVIIFGG